MSDITERHLTDDQIQQVVEDSLVDAPAARREHRLELEHTIVCDTCVEMLQNARDARHLSTEELKELLHAINGVKQKDLRKSELRFEERFRHLNRCVECQVAIDDLLPPVPARPRPVSTESLESLAEWLSTVSPFPDEEEAQGKELPKP